MECKVRSQSLHGSVLSESSGRNWTQNRALTGLVSDCLLPQLLLSLAVVFQNFSRGGATHVPNTPIHPIQGTPGRLKYGYHQSPTW